MSTEAPTSTSQWDAADYARVGGFVPALEEAALDLLDPQPGEHILDAVSYTHLSLPTKRIV